MILVLKCHFYILHVLQGFIGRDTIKISWADATINDDDDDDDDDHEEHNANEGNSRESD